MIRRFTWPVSWLVAAAWYVLVVADAIQDAPRRTAETQALCGALKPSSCWPRPCCAALSRSPAYWLAVWLAGFLETIGAP